MQDICFGLTTLVVQWTLGRASICLAFHLGKVCLANVTRIVSFLCHAKNDTASWQEDVLHAIHAPHTIAYSLPCLAFSLLFPSSTGIESARNLHVPVTAVAFFHRVFRDQLLLELLLAII